jgi:hypothetical protein
MKGEAQKRPNCPAYWHSGGSTAPHRLAGVSRLLAYAFTQQI